jgi:hypothetical protein
MIKDGRFRSITGRLLYSTQISGRLDPIERRSISESASLCTSMIVWLVLRHLLNPLAHRFHYECP